MMRAASLFLGASAPGEYAAIAANASRGALPPTEPCSVGRRRRARTGPLTEPRSVGGRASRSRPRVFRRQRNPVPLEGVGARGRAR